MVLQKITVEGFEGPLDLLLDLIENEKLDINRVSLAQVTNQYLEKLRELNNLSPQEIAEFLVVAARLILIKSQRLLPEFSISQEEEEGIISLEEQLKEYQKFRDKGQLFKKKWNEGPVCFSREGFMGWSVAFFPPENFSVIDLNKFVGNVIKSLPIFEKVGQEAVAKVISLETKIDELKDRIQKTITTSFTEAMKGAKKADVIVSFLAMLELIKQKIVSVEQKNHFQDIIISKRTNE